MRCYQIKLGGNVCGEDDEEPEPMTREKRFSGLLPADHFQNCSTRVIGQERDQEVADPLGLVFHGEVAAAG